MKHNIKSLRVELNWFIVGFMIATILFNPLIVGYWSNAPEISFIVQVLTMAVFIINNKKVIKEMCNL